MSTPNTISMYKSLDNTATKVQISFETFSKISKNVCFVITNF